jgi:hypothetical protein
MDSTLRRMNVYKAIGWYGKAARLYYEDAQAKLKVLKAQEIQ